MMPYQRKYNRTKCVVCVWFSRNLFYGGHALANSEAQFQINVTCRKPIWMAKYPELRLGFLKKKTQQLHLMKIVW